MKFEFNTVAAQHLEHVINNFMMEISDNSVAALGFVDAEVADLQDICCEILDKLEGVTGSKEYE